MVLADRLSSAREILEAHNKASDAPIDVDAFFAKLKQMGGTTEVALAEATWEDLQECSAPRILARQIAQVFRDEEKKEEADGHTHIVIDDSDPVKRAQRLSPKELIAEYDPKQPRNPFGERLKTLSEGKRFLVFNDDGTVNAEESVKLFDELEDFEERETATVDGKPRKVYRVGDRPGRTADEHPLYPGVALRAGGRSEADCNWGEIPLKTRQVYRLAVEVGELNPAEFREADLHMEATTRTEEEILRLYRKAAVRWQELDSIGKLPPLKVTLGGEKKQSERSNHPFGAHRVT